MEGAGSTLVLQRETVARVPFSHVLPYARLSVACLPSPRHFALPRFYVLRLEVFFVFLQPSPVYVLPLYSKPLCPLMLLAVQTALVDDL